MFGPWEWILVVLIALLIFGPAMFIRAGSSLGSGVGAFKKAMREGESQVRDDSRPAG
ncbi:MAG: twin-arginine translocase TatA/TatE family subunit [Candidatus Eremiobacterota bacterium]